MKPLKVPVPSGHEFVVTNSNRQRISSLNSFNHSSTCICDQGFLKVPAPSDDWLDKKLETAKPLEIVGGLRHDPIFNRLVGHIHKAYKQFLAVNPERKYPNVLVFMNSDKQCDNRDLVAVMTGNFYLEGGGAEPIYTAYSEGKIKEEKFAIDLYVWFEESKGQDQKGFRYFITNGPHYAALCALLGSDSSKHVRP